MKAQFLLVIALFSSFWGTAQHPATWSAPTTRLSYRVRDIHYFKDHGYVLRVNMDGFVYSKKNKSAIEQLDNRLNYTKEYEIALEYEGARAEPRKMITINDKLYLLFSGYPDKEERLLLYEIDPETLNFSNEPVLLGKVRSARSQIWMAQSKNGRFFSVLAYWGEKDKSKAYLACYDSNFQLQYEDEKEIDLKYYYNGCSQLLVDNHGNTFAVMEDAPNILGTPVLWQRYKSGESIARPLASENAKSKIRTFRATVSDEVVLLAGYHTEQYLVDDRVKGITFMAFDKENKGISKQSQVTVPRDMSKYIQYSTSKKYKDTEEEIPALTMIDLMDWDGHGYLVIGERRYVYTPYKGDPTAVYAVAFVSLMDYSLSKIKWTVPVCKYYIAQFNGNGLFLTIEEDKVHVFFNSDDSNNKKREEAPLYGNGLIQMTITSEGKYNTQVFHERTEDMYIYPKMIRPIDRKNMFVMAGKTYKEKFGIIRW